MCNQKFRKIDIFGNGVRFQVEKGETYKTCRGAFATLLMYILVVAFAAWLMS